MRALRVPRASARAATWVSSNGCRTPATSWYGSWPLPATSTMSSGPASPTARAIAAARSRSTLHCVRRSEAGDDLGDDGVAVFAARVVVGDDHEVGSALGDRRHLRTLAAVAFAAAAEHADQPPARVRAQRWPAPVPAHRACARSRSTTSGSAVVAAERGSCGRRSAAAATASRRRRPAPRRARAARRRPRAGCRR